MNLNIFGGLLPPFFICKTRLSPPIFIIVTLCPLDVGELHKNRACGGGQRITLKKLDISLHFYVIL